MKRQQRLRIARDLARLDPRRVDPYLHWALDTDFAGFGGDVAPDGHVQFIAELAAPGAAVQLKRSAWVAPCYLADPSTRFCTLRVAWSGVADLLAHPAVVRAELGLPCRQVQGGRRAESIGQASIDGTGPVVGVIDHGIAFLHRQFRDSSGMPRVHRLWDQWLGLPPIRSERAVHDSELASPWKAGAGFGYGRWLEAEAIRALGAFDERRAYAQLGCSLLQGARSHGTHVMDIAAGARYPLAHPGADAADAASRSPIIAVQLPWFPAADVAGAGLGVNVLDALRFIVGSVAGDAVLARNVIVNLSDGAMAGSHNAGSVIEAAIDELIRHQRGLSLVIAAGNGYEAAAHACGELSPASPTNLTWRVLPDDRTESYLEVWVPEPGAVELCLREPGGAVVLELTSSGRRTWVQGSAGLVLAAAYAAESVAIGNGQLFLVALRPSRSEQGGTVPHGDWQVALRSLDGRSHRFDAWIERDDPPFADAGPRRQSRFVEAAPRHVCPRNTMNSLATGDEPIVVGGYQWRDGRPAPYSAAAAKGEKGLRPTVAAPSDESAVLPGLRAAGNLGMTTVRMNGTSVAAPIVTRLLLNAAAAVAPPGQVVENRTLREALKSVAELKPSKADPQRPDAQIDDALRLGAGRLSPERPIVL